MLCCRKQISLCLKHRPGAMGVSKPQGVHFNSMFSFTQLPSLLGLLKLSNIYFSIWAQAQGLPCAETSLPQEPADEVRHSPPSKPGGFNKTSTIERPVHVLGFFRIPLLRFFLGYLNSQIKAALKVKQVHLQSSGEMKELPWGSNEGKEGGRNCEFCWDLLSTPDTEQPKVPVLGRLRWDVGNTGTGKAANSSAPPQGKE